MVGPVGHHDRGLAGHRGDDEVPGPCDRGGHERAHLAGALGVPVWVEMPLANDWRWLLDRDDTPWYPTMRLFRQTRLGDWDEVIKRMAGALEGQVSACSSQLVGHAD